MSATQHPKPSPAHPLDNIIWQALSTRQQDVARIEGPARKFHDDIGPLAGITGDRAAGLAALEKLAIGGNIVALFTQAEDPYDGWTIVAQAPLVQMARDKAVALAPVPLRDAEVATLRHADSAAMQELAGLVRPGPFGPRTHELGDFYGVRQKGVLVAMAGERMKVPGYTEVSAVCTHPDHLGKGYAAALMTRVIAGIEGRGETAFLHSRADNDRAVALYERLGFRARWSGFFVAMTR